MNTKVERQGQSVQVFVQVLMCLFTVYIEGWVKGIYTPTRRVYLLLVWIGAMNMKPKAHASPIRAARVDSFG